LYLVALRSFLSACYRHHPHFATSQNFLLLLQTLLLSAQNFLLFRQTSFPPPLFSTNFWLFILVLEVRHRVTSDSTSNLLVCGTLVTTTFEGSADFLAHPFRQFISIMPRSGRYRTHPYRRQNGPKITYATDVSALNTPEAVRKVRRNLDGVLHIRRDMSPVSRNERLLLGAARPLLDSQARFSDSMQEALRELRAHREEIQAHREEIQVLQGEVWFLRENRATLIKRELICAVYTALGHPDNTPRTSTYDWIVHQKPLLESIFNVNHEKLKEILRLLDPRQKGSLIKAGNMVAHCHSLADAREVIYEDALITILDLLDQATPDTTTDLQSAAHTLRLQLVDDHPILAEIPDADDSFRERAKEKEDLINEIRQINEGLINKIRMDFQFSARPTNPPPAPNFSPNPTQLPLSSFPPQETWPSWSY
jgi:hypothetical protein